jgi:hypothetical protein
MNRVTSALFIVVLSGVLTASVAIAASSMAGETFTGTWTISSTTDVPAVTANCADLVSATVKYTSTTATGSTALAAGPYPGYYTESGTVTVTGAVITAWTATWSVASTPGGAPYVSGTKTLSVGGAAPTFICFTNFAAGTLTATLTHSASSAPGPRPAGIPAFVGPANGLATASLTFNTTSLGDPPTPGTASGSFTETFLGSAPPPSRGCNTDGDSNGNDECEQEGEN